MTAAEIASARGSRRGAVLSRLHDDAGRIKTLYQVPYEASRFGVLPDLRAGESPWSAQVRGLTVELWVEKGVFFAQPCG